ncbi:MULTISPECIES: UDP-3-O-(3-hydroxymyristoyl)glucosamine N-acyltransferase [Fusobacterium]|uniref:UDP-3-O-(3-hydroxymyristoyl)glucosamine N-acyltransferase n=1 Tax=Fusobacterium TaxID=848 RepID=UPI0014772D09|nr:MULTISPECIES: UDP-3-O-(3-hydroxymyristoyl)glucosamine N-acyltransferase [Fusobacterium]NME35807.1 UDP-3-O-(3-hydroxymyristoyl)glucosamine N-acyltransferase [Fusobacterium sp. FSA-380-WT-3A]
MIKKFEYNVSKLDKSYNFSIYNASTIGNPKDNTIIFLKKNSEELLNKLVGIKNSLLIILDGINAENFKKNNLVIHDKNPRLKYAILLTEILKTNKKKNKIFFKDGYYYGENCEFGENVIIEPFVKIGNNVKIGDNTIIKSGVKIGDFVTIGNNCYIRENSVIGGEGFGIETTEKGENIRLPHIGGVIIKDNVEIGALTTVCSGTIEETLVEDYVKVDDHVHIAHNVKLRKGCKVVAGSVIGGSTEIGQDGWIGINSSIKNGIKIGENVTLGMASRIVNNIKNNQVLTNEKADTLENIIKYTKYKKKLLETL